MNEIWSKECKQNENTFVDLWCFKCDSFLFFNRRNSLDSFPIHKTAVMQHFDGNISKTVITFFSMNSKHFTRTGNVLAIYRCLEFITFYVYIFSTKCYSIDVQSKPSLRMLSDWKCIQVKVWCIIISTRPEPLLFMMEQKPLNVSMLLM